MRNFFISVILLLGLACDQQPAWIAELPDGIYAHIVTSNGDIVCRLSYDKAPMTVANFIGLAEGTIANTFRPKGEPFFDGLTIHRVDKGFVIQGGDPMGNGMGTPGYSFNNEIHPELKHNLAGTLAMANSGPNRNGCQFYITQRATPELDGNYNVFGYVTRGLENVYKIAIGDLLESITIIRKGTDAQAFDATSVFYEMSKVSPELAPATPAPAQEGN
ncbi:MAG: peptidylprolyl isomerase [Bacteroidota bacterium]